MTICKKKSPRVFEVISKPTRKHLYWYEIHLGEPQCRQFNLWPLNIFFSDQDRAGERILERSHPG